MPIDRRGRTYASNVEGAQRTTSACTVPIHGEGTPGSGSFVVPIDLRPQRITTGGNDGWRIVDNGFHFALGQPAGRATDGWIGFGGRQGQHWLWSRLQGVGYIHGPTRTFRDLGGPPTFTRDNLVAERTQALSLGGETFSRKARVVWSDLWPALPQGQVDLVLGIQGHRVKEFIRVDAAARNWIRDNRPPLTPANETWFGFIWEIDFADIPQLWRDGVQIGTGEDFDDVAGAIEMRTAIGERLGLLTPGRSWVHGARRGDNRIAPALQRFWNGNQFFVGVRVSHLAQFVAGDLIIDPPQTTDTATGGDCGQQDSTIWDADGFGGINYIDNGPPVANVGLRFDMTAMNADTVSAATITWDYGNDNSIGSTMSWRFRAQDIANAPAFANASLPSDFDDATNGTVATVGDSRNTNPTSGAAYTSPSLVTIVQELVTNFGDTITNMRFAIVETPTSANYVSTYDDSAAGEADPAISVTQTAGGGAATVTPANASLSFGGLAATIYTQTVATPANATLSCQGLAPSVMTQIVVGPDNASLSFQGLGPTVYLERIVSPDNASLSFVGLAPNLLTQTVVIPANASLSFVGLAPTIIAGDTIIATPGNASLSFQGAEPTLLLEIAVSPANASLSFQGAAPTILTDAPQATIRGHGGRRWRSRIYTYSYSDEVEIGPMLPPAPAPAATLAKQPAREGGLGLTYIEPVDFTPKTLHQAVAADRRGEVARQAEAEISELLRRRKRRRQQQAIALLLT